MWKRKWVEISAEQPDPDSAMQIAVSSREWLVLNIISCVYFCAYRKFEAKISTNTKSVDDWNRPSLVLVGGGWVYFGPKFEFWEIF